MHEIVASEGLPTVDFLKIDVRRTDVEAIESAREELRTRRMLSVGTEVNWFGSASPTATTQTASCASWDRHGSD